MDEPNDSDLDETEEIEIIELEDPIEEGILDFEEIVGRTDPSFPASSFSVFDNITDEDVSQVIDLSILTFTGHSKSVFQGALNAAGTIAATGGEDDTAFIWFTETGEILLECTGHKDSVTQLVFNFDEQLLATGDMGGLIQVWNLTEKKLIWCYEGDDLEWLLWHPKANVLFAGCAFGNVFLWQIPQGNCKVLPSRGSTSSCGHILSDGVRLLAGYSDGRIRLWDIKTISVIWELQHDIPINGVTSMHVTKDDSLFIVAPSAQVFKVSDGSLVTTLLSANETDIEAVAFSDESGLVATGAISGTACIWDFKTNCIRHSANLGTSITSIKWGPNDTLIIGSANANIYIVDGKIGQLNQTLTGHQLDVFSISLSKDGSVILSTSDDSTAKIFTIKNSTSDS